jgi:hypothetical protein
MAKQTFTSNQVLTAAQMTSLQQTAMGGGSTTAKTTSYVLVAADAGTTVAMNAAGSTTITVNTSLFSAGDSVFIQNWGAGVCTVTAGTATVTTSGSLVLAQNQGGKLYFTSASAAIFFQFATPASGDIEGVTAGVGISGGGTSGTVTVTNSMATAITTAGDLIKGTGSGTFDRLGIGSTGQVLTVASGAPSWATPTGSSATWSILNSGGTALTGAATITVSGISGYNSFMVLVSGASSVSAGSGIGIRMNGISTPKYYQYGSNRIMASTYSASQSDVVNGVSSNIPLGQMSSVANSTVSGYCMITGANQTTVPVFQAAGAGNAPTGNGNQSYTTGGYFDNNATVISSISLFSDSGNFDAGTLFIYGSTI